MCLLFLLSTKRVLFKMIVYLPKVWLTNKEVRGILPEMKKHLIDLTKVYNVVYVYSEDFGVYTNISEHSFILNKLVNIYLGEFI